MFKYGQKKMLDGMLKSGTLPTECMIEIKVP
jgi:hypothetical protein